MQTGEGRSRQADRQAYIQTYRQTDRQTCLLVDIAVQTERHTNKGQTARSTDNNRIPLIAIVQLITWLN